MSKIRFHKERGGLQTFSLYVFAFSVLLSELSQPTESIEPEDLWIAINITLGDLDKTPVKCCGCVKIVLHNKDVGKYFNQSLVGSDIMPIDIDSNTPDGFMTEELVKDVRTQVMKPRDHTKCQPCILVISLVNTKEQVGSMGSASEADLDEKKLQWSLQFAKMLQFRMPLHSRHLVLVRFGRSPNEFGQCRKKLPYLKYPRRLVPLWEQVLFDYFPEARVLLAVDDMKTVPTRREEANFVWLCEEIMTRLDEEDKCKANMTETCREKMAKGGYSSLGLNMTSCTLHTPRM